MDATEGQVRGSLERASRELRINPPFLGPGAFRHHCATWAADLGYTQEQIAAVLSHARPGVTARYIHSQSVTLKRQILEAVEARFLQALQA